jgi:hypothetical protein
MRIFEFFQLGALGAPSALLRTCFARGPFCSLLLTANRLLLTDKLPTVLLDDLSQCDNNVANISFCHSRINR